jgi:hypothetical protein
MATNAYLQWALGPSFSARLLGITEMPKQGEKIPFSQRVLLPTMHSSGDVPALSLAQRTVLFAKLFMHTLVIASPLSSADQSI